MLELTNKKLENAEVVAAKGRLDTATSRLLEAHCRDLLCAGCKCVVLDFSDLQFLSSEGLRTILGLSKRIRARGGKLIFTGIRGPIRDMFDIAGFLEVFPVVDQLESGIA
jgi:stage II sporulation protein AA (anti-sigma F factor antagonist)